MRYAQLSNGVLHWAPRHISHDDKLIYNPPAEMLTELGYKPVKYTETPGDAPDGYYYASGWEETSDTIVQTWHLEELPPDDLTAEEIVAAIQEAMA